MSCPSRERPGGRAQARSPAGLTAPAARLRRALFFAAVLLTTAAGTVMMFDIVRANGTTIVEMAILALFSVTFGWIALAFWTAVVGFALRLARVDPLSLRPGCAPAPAAPVTARVAVVMPVYNEDPAAVLAGLEATIRSLQATGVAEPFDFYLLSDSTDARIATAETHGVLALRARLAGKPMLYYRRRARNVGRKAGNIADFCRRWGRRYDFMVVLDADSIMSGATLLALVRAMQASPRAGIIQTAPLPVGQQTPFGRFVQFAARLYGPMLATGLAWWQAGEANYWGHNAIIRVAPFMRHCGLPTLPGKPPLGGEILSHDFVEAALLRRAGWQVHLLADLEGSYEGVPGNLLDFAARDRRWSQGNLQHLKLLPLRGLHRISRAHFLFGALAYASSLLWLLLLVLSTADALQRALLPHEFFGPGYQLFPDWPIAKTGEIVSLLSVTLSMLLLPKMAGLALCLLHRERRAGFGGAVRVIVGAVAEVAFSVLIAPVMMCFHAYFVVATLAGRAVAWNPQARGARRIGAAEAARYGLVPTLLGATWAAATWVLAPQFFWWLTPVLAGLVLSMPVLIASSDARIGRALRRLGLWLTPEERMPPVELQLASSSELGTLPASPEGMERALVPPEMHGEMPAQPYETWWSWRMPRDRAPTQLRA